MRFAVVSLCLLSSLAACRERTSGGAQVLSTSARAGDVGGGAGPDAGTKGPPLAVQWIHGSLHCVNNHDPGVQVFNYDDDTVILRQNKCAQPPNVSYEAPFVYLLFGADKVLMLDSGSIPDPRFVPMRSTVDQLISAWLAKKQQTSIQLIVAHSHSHGDHIAGDAQFRDRPNTTMVPYGQDAVGQFFGFSGWQSDPVSYDLGGGRAVDVMPIPGHYDDHIAVYDRKDKLILSGDSLYPGHIFISSWSSYRQSIARLAQFAADKPVAYVLGAHVEAKAQTGQFFEYGETFQPNEHALELFKGHLAELNQALQDIGEQPKDEFHGDFHIQPN